MKDAGYDVSDYRDIEPVFGTLDEAEAMIKESHDLGLQGAARHRAQPHLRPARLVPAGARGGARLARARPVPVPRGSRRERRAAAERLGEPVRWPRLDPGAATASGTSTCSRPSSPTSTGRTPRCVADFEDTLRFWFDRGVDGFRIDVAHGLVKAEGLVDVGDVVWPAAHRGDRPLRRAPVLGPAGASTTSTAPGAGSPTPTTTSGSSSPRRGCSRPRGSSTTSADDELHTAFNFEFLNAPWRADMLRRTIDRTVAAHQRVGAPPTWVLANHDVPREVSRYARPQPLHDDRRVAG